MAHHDAGVAELADALDLGSSAFGVGVQVPPPAPSNSFQLRRFNFRAGMKLVVLLSTPAWKIEVRSWKLEKHLKTCFEI